MAGLLRSFPCGLLHYWKPKSVWRFREEPQQTIDSKLKYSAGQVFRAWSPFIIMTIFIVAWGLQPVKDALNYAGILKFDLPGLNNSIIKADGSPLVIKPFEFNYFSTPGTALLFAAFIFIPLVGMTYRQGQRSIGTTLKQLAFPVITIAAVVGFASLPTTQEVYHHGRWHSPRRAHYFHSSHLSLDGWVYFSRVLTHRQMHCSANFRRLRRIPWALIRL